MKYLTLAATTLFATQAWADTPELVVYTYDSFVAEWGPGPVIEAATVPHCWRGSSWKAHGLTPIWCWGLIPA